MSTSETSDGRRSSDNTAPVTATVDLRCSSWTRSALVDPVGTAGSYAGFLLIEWPLPWPRDLSEVRGLEQVSRAAGAAGVRLQGVVPDGDAEQRVALYRWDAAAARFVGVEAPAASAPETTALALLAGDRPAGWGPIEGTDVLVCGHGRRDRCCGSLGTALEMELRAGGPIDRPGGVRVRRTSHTGGHRFAPTAIVLPEGASWGYLDAGLLRRIVSRDIATTEVSGHYRGCSGWSSPEAQAVERSVLERVGWRLFDLPRRCIHHGDGTVSLTVNDGRRVRTWTARVVTRRVLPVPTCGVDLTGAEKTEAELSVEGLAEVSS
jgi:hypothetical protein